MTSLKALVYIACSIAKDDTKLPLRSTSKIADCWEPPAYIAKEGKINCSGEPILYTTKDPRIAIEEAKIKDNQWFSMVVYEKIEPFTVFPIEYSKKHCP